MKRTYLTKKCLLWLDKGTRKQCQQPGRTAGQAALAAVHFRKRHGVLPAVIYVHPDSAAEEFTITVRKAVVLVVPKKGTIARHYRVCKEVDPCSNQLSKQCK